jgi:hypothetical protein
MELQVFQAAPEPKQMVTVRGFRHNTLYRTPSEEWWGPVIQFLRGKTAPPEAQPQAGSNTQSK